MTQLLEKIVRNAIAENKYIFGSKQILSSIQNSKLIIISKLIDNPILVKVIHEAKKENIPIIIIQNPNYKIEKICGIQFRASVMSITSINDQNIKLLLQESQNIDSKSNNSSYKFK